MDTSSNLIQIISKPSILYVLSLQLGVDGMAIPRDKAYRDHCLKNGVQIDKSKLNQGKLRKRLNAIKHTQFPFMLEVTKCSPQLAIIQLGDALKHFLKGEAKYP